MKIAKPIPAQSVPFKMALIVLNLTDFIAVFGGVFH